MIIGSDFYKWLKIFGVTTGGGPPPSGALLAVNNLSDVANSTTSVENIGLGRPGILLLTDADFAAGGGTYVLTNPPPIIISMSATAPGRILQLPPQNQPTSLQDSNKIEILTGSGQAINIANGAGTVIFQVQPNSAWNAVPNDRTSIAGAWVFLGDVQTINGSHTGDVELSSSAQVIYISNDGSDVPAQNDGTILFPYASLSYALSQTAPTSSAPIYYSMSPGVYTETNLVLKPWSFISGSEGAQLTVSGSITLDASWSGGGAIGIQHFLNLDWPATVTLDFDAAGSPFTLFNFSNNITQSATTLSVIGQTANGAISIIGNNFGFAAQFNYNVTNCYGSIGSGAVGDVNITNSSETAGGNFSLVNLTMLGNAVITSSTTAGFTFFHEGCKAIGSVSYSETGAGTANYFAKGMTYFSAPSVDGGTGGGTAVFTADILSILPVLSNGATYVASTISNSINANYPSPVNFSYPPGDTSVHGAIQGIDAALTGGGSGFTPLGLPIQYSDNSSHNLTNPMPSEVDVNFTTPGLEIRLAVANAANSMSPSQRIRVTNSGTVPIVYKPDSGALIIVTVNPGQIYDIQMTDNSTADGTYVPEAYVSSVNGLNGNPVLTGANVNSLYTPVNYVPTSSSIDGNLEGIDNALSGSLPGIPGAYGEMYVNANTRNTTFPSAAFTKIEAGNPLAPTPDFSGYVVGDLQAFTFANGRLTYTGSGPIEMDVLCELTLILATGTTVEYSVALAKNGTVITKSQANVLLTFVAGGNPQPITTSALVSLTTGDYLEVFASNVANTGNAFLARYLDFKTSNAGSLSGATVAPSYGEMYFQGNATLTPIAALNTPVKVAATYSSGVLNGFSQASGTLTYIGADPIVAFVSADLTATYNGTAQNTSFYLALNGVVVAKSKQQTFIGPVTPATQTNPVKGLISLVTGDTLELWAENNDNANQMIVQDLNFSVNSINAYASGTIILAGENYLSLSGNTLTANPINLAGTNVTGLLPLNKVADVSTTLNGMTLNGSGGVNAGAAVVASQEIRIGNIVTGSIMISFNSQSLTNFFTVTKSYGGTFTNIRQALGAGICNRDPGTFPSITDGSVMTGVQAIGAFGVRFDSTVTALSTDYLLEATFTYQVI